MSQYIEITDMAGNYIPAPLVSDITIEKSIKNLADTATLTCAIFHLNQLLKYKEAFDDDGNSQNKIYKLYKRGQKIKIHLGYDNILKTEFVGYIREVKIKDDAMTIECEDELFMFRGKKIPNKVFTEVSVKKIARYLCDNTNRKIKVICDYDMSYERFTIYQANGMDVLQQIQQDTGADIYFKSALSNEIGNNTNIFDLITSRQIENFEAEPKQENLELHIRMPYLKKEKTESNVDFSFQHNIESSSLDYIDTTDKTVKVRIKTSNVNGTEYSAVNYTTIPRQSAPLIPRQSAPLKCII